MEWKFGVTASSDDLESVGIPFFANETGDKQGGSSGSSDTTGANNSNGTETVYMELPSTTILRLFGRNGKGTFHNRFFSG